jgi:SAM-dependent methyltransferase
MRSRLLLRAMLAGAALLLLLLAAYALLPGPPRPQQALPEDFDTAKFVAGQPKLDAPYIASDLEVVDAMLGMAEVRPDDYVIDLGSGDGRILIAAARSLGARGLGVDIDPDRIEEANANARAAGVTTRVSFRRQDLFETALAEADVLTLYLLREVNLRLRPRILTQMRPGTRVVSHDYDMGEWRPDQRRRVGEATVLLWIVPARIEGRWALTDGARAATLELDQQFQAFIGTATSGERQARIEQGSIAGTRVRFIVDLGEGRRVYEGRIEGDAIVPEGGRGRWRMARAA